MEETNHLLLPGLKEYVERISGKWLLGILLLLSMTLQLVLVVLGARRYHTSGRIFRFVVWGAYISADTVAISALGSMMHSCAPTGIFGIWAPVLLLHLGGPDAITAYSVADNELWLRHGFNMVYQVSVAVYVIYSSALEGYALVSAILLLVVGATKYAERTLALWFASDSQIVTSCAPVLNYIKENNSIQDRGYVVKGEKQLQRMVERKDIEAGQKAPSQKGRGIVTTKDVKDAGVNEEDFNLCLSHALFKLYMRRFVSLYFNEGDWKETRAFWVKLSGKEAFRIAERELKFMYDVLFSKRSRTEFSRLGILLRVLNCVLMGAAGFLILREREHREVERTMTYVVISVALVVEVYQFCRIIVSDWTKVRLICSRVDDIKQPLPESAIKWCRISILKVMEIAVLLLGKVHSLVGGDRYSSNRIHQQCPIDSCHKWPHLVWKVAISFPKVGIYITSWNIDKVSVEKELIEFIFDILKRKCSPHYDSETCREVIYNFEEDLFENEPDIRNVMPSHDNLEAVILVWHIATTICESGGIQNDNVRWSRILSRYCVYLLLSRPRLLPVHPDMAITAYMQLVERLMAKEYYRKESRELLGCTDQSVLGSGTKLALKLLEKVEEDRWTLLASYWAELLIYISVYNKASFHAESIAGGGEFLSQLWVLVGHMGCGEQSDSAVRKKIEMPMERERRRRKLEQQRLEGNRLDADQLERERLERERLGQDRQERERLARDLLEWDRLERERQERHRLGQDSQERERLESERLDWNRLERDRLEQKHRERDRLERERLKGERLERDRQERERLAQDLLKLDRSERERLEHERQEEDRLERARLALERSTLDDRERQRLEGDRLEQDRLERERLERDRLQQERLECERLEQESLEGDRLEREHLTRDCLERERLERERLVRDRQERQRLEADRLEEDRLERERLEQKRLEWDYQEGEKTAEEVLISDRLERKRLKQEREGCDRLERQSLERERQEWERRTRDDLARKTLELDDRARKRLAQGRL